MNRKNKLLVSTILTLALLISIYAIVSTDFLNSQTKNSEKEPIKIGVFAWPGWGPLYLAEEKGFFEENGVDVELVYIDSTLWPTFLTSNEVDGGPVTLDIIQLVGDRNITQFVIVAPVDQSYGGDGILAAGDITEIRDLAGRRIAFPKGTISNVFLFYILEKENMSPSNIISVDMDAAAAGAAFASGNVDVAVTWEPWLSSSLKAREGSHILIDSKEKPELTSGYLTFKKEVVEKRPEDIKGVIRGWYAALEYMEKNPEDANRIMAKSQGLSVDEFLAVKSHERWIDYNESKELFGTKQNPGKIYDLLNVTGDVLLTEGYIDKKIGCDVIDSSYLETLYN